jgi:hypothetical protein
MHRSTDGRRNCPRPARTDGGMPCGSMAASHCGRSTRSAWRPSRSQPSRPRRNQACSHGRRQAVDTHRHDRPRASNVSAEAYRERFHKPWETRLCPRTAHGLPVMPRRRRAAGLLAGRLGATDLRCQGQLLPGLVTIRCICFGIRVPGSAPVGDLDPHRTARDLDRNCDRLAGITRPDMPNAVAEYLAHQQDSNIRAGRPGPSTAATKARATRARSARPASVTVSRTASPAITAPAFPARTAPGNHGPPGGHTGMHARLGGRRQARTRPGPAPEPVKRLRTPLPGPDSRPLCVRGPRNTPPYSATR